MIVGLESIKPQSQNLASRLYCQDESAEKCSVFKRAEDADSSCQNTSEACYWRKVSKVIGIKELANGEK